MDPDYDNEFRIHKGTFYKLINILRKRDQDIYQTSLGSSQKNKLTRHAKFYGDESDDDVQLK